MAKANAQHTYQDIWEAKQQLYHILQNYVYTALSYKQFTTASTNYLANAFDQHIQKEYLHLLDEIQDNLHHTIETLNDKKEVSETSTLDNLLEDESDTFLINTKKSLNKNNTLSSLHHLQKEHQLLQSSIKNSNSMNLHTLQNSLTLVPKEKISQAKYLSTKDHYLTVEEDATIDDTQYIAGYGHTILLTLKNGKQYLFGKLHQIFVRKGEHIIAGDHIGFSTNRYQTLNITP